MNTQEISHEAEIIVNQLRQIKGSSNLDLILILNTALMVVNTWQVHRAIKQMEADGTDGYPN